MFYDFFNRIYLSYILKTPQGRQPSPFWQISAYNFPPFNMQESLKSLETLFLDKNAT